MLFIFASNTFDAFSYISFLFGSVSLDAFSLRRSRSCERVSRGAFFPYLPYSQLFSADIQESFTLISMIFHSLFLLISDTI